MDDCIEWAGGRSTLGYGRVYGNGSRGRYAHRVAYEDAFGTIPDGMVVCHRCDNPPCVNPAHLFLGTQVDNLRDAITKGHMPSGDRHWTRRKPDLLAAMNERRETAIGERHGRATLTNEQAEAIRQSAEPGVVLAKRYGVSPNTVSRVRRRITYQHP